MSDIILQSKDGEILASSREIAEKFGKRQTHVLDIIKQYSSKIDTAEFSALFTLTDYRASNGKLNFEYLMNRDGFSLLAMGYFKENFHVDLVRQCENYNDKQELKKDRLSIIRYAEKFGYTDDLYVCCGKLYESEVNSILEEINKIHK